MRFGLMKNFYYICSTNVKNLIIKPVGGINLVHT